MADEFERILTHYAPTRPYTPAWLPEEFAVDRRESPDTFLRGEFAADAAENLRMRGGVPAGTDPTGDFPRPISRYSSQHGFKSGSDFRTDRDKFIDRFGAAPEIPSGEFFKQTLRNFGDQALHMIPGVSAGVDAYRAYREDRPWAAGGNAARGAAELALMGMAPALARANFPAVNVVDKIGNAADASMAIRKPPMGDWAVAGPASFGIQPSQELLRRAGRGHAQDWSETYGSAPPRVRQDWGVPMPATQGKPRFDKGVSTSENLVGGNNFSYTLYRDGKPFGEASGWVNGDKAHISFIGGSYETGPNSIGVAGVRQLREAIRQDFPEAKVFSGHRVSGARRGPAARPNADRRQSVRLDDFGMPIAGGGLAAYMLSPEDAWADAPENVTPSRDDNLLRRFANPDRY